MEKSIRPMTVCLLAGLLTGCATTSPKPQAASNEDPGYFLTLAQKGQLIAQGRIRDSRTNSYDVWIVPGYVPPLERAGRYLVRSGDAFAKYGGKEKYHDLGRQSSDAFDWAYTDCLHHFIWRNLPRAWGQYWSEADARAQKRVFGWWFAYPWAFMESTVDPLVRVPMGLCGAVLGTAAGVAVVPAYHAVDSSVEGLWYITADGVLVPAMGCAWNTVIAPPMALVGQKPAPARVDGFWVTMDSPREQAGQEKLETHPSDEEVRDLVQWGRVLLQEVPPFEERRRQENAAVQAQIRAAYANQQTNLDLIAREEKARLQAVAAAAENAPMLDALRAGGFTSARVAKVAVPLQQALSTATNLTVSDRMRIEALLRQYPPVSFEQKGPSSARPKTDPVQDSARVIQGIR